MTQFRRSLPALVFLGLVPLFSSCLDVASNRAARDLTIGHASTGNPRIDVEDGLAAIRGSNDTEVHLWASAPTLSLRLERTPQSVGPLRIRIENILNDAELVPADNESTGMIISVVANPHPTEKTWEIVSSAQSMTLKLRAPDDTLRQPWRFAVYADVQEALGNVQDIYTKMNETPNIRFSLISGDLTSQGRQEELEEFQTSMKQLKFPCFATLGNHELGTREDLYHDYFGRGNYSFVFRDARFTMLDSASATLDPLVYSWLDGWLDKGHDQLHVVTMHIAPIDPVGARNGSFASRAEADQLLVKLAQGKTDLTLYGHVHSFYAFENAAIPAYISGGGGAIPERMDGIGRHFLTVDVDAAGKIEQVAVVRVD